jgi:hypothetical protein
MPISHLFKNAKQNIIVAGNALNKPIEVPTVPLEVTTPNTFSARSWSGSPYGRLSELDKKIKEYTENCRDTASLEKARCRVLSDLMESKYSSDRLQYIRDQTDDNGLERNKMITKEYARLGLEIDRLLGGGTGANWAMYGAIASDTVGKAMRNEVDPLFDLPGPFNGGFPRDSDSAIPALIRGNREIFQSIGPALHTFIAFLSENGQNKASQKQFNAFMDEHQVEEVTMLREGLFNLYQAKFENDPTAKQELTALSTLQIAAHEQELVQEELHTIFNDRPWYADVFNFISGNEVKDRMNEEVKLAWDGFSTRATENSPETNKFELKYDNQIEPSNIQNADLEDLIKKYQQKGKSEGQAADDYDDFGERMNWLAANMIRHGTQSGIWSSVTRIGEQSPCERSEWDYEPAPPAG